MYTHARMSSYAHRHTLCTHQCTHKYYSIYQREAKVQQMFVFQLKEWLLSLFFFSSSCTLSLLKRLRPTGINGSKDTSCFDFSVANYSALTWAAYFLRQVALFFSLIWKRGDWLLRGKSSRRLVSESRYRHTRLRPMSNAALCITADMPTCSSSTRAQAQKLTPAVKLQTRTNTFTKRNHKWLDSILQRSLGALVLNARVKKRSTETTVLVSACSTDLLWPPVHSNLHLNMGSALNEKVSGWCLQKKKKSFVLHALSIPHSYTVSRGSRDSLITHTHALLPHLSCSITCYVICAKHIGYILWLCLYDTRILKASKHEYNVASNSVEAGFSGQIRSIYSKVALKQTGLI